MLAHETAHVQRGDTLFATVVSLFATLVPLPGYIALMRDWEVAAEHTCDRIAAERVGDAYAVASALVTVAHLLATEPPPSSPAIVAFSSQRKEGGVQKRVQALLLTTQGGRDERGRMQMLIAFWGVGLLASILLTPYLCHVMELLFLH
jgi:Zn-dependent protease with chaperone function